MGLEAAKTVLEVADVAWTAVECCHHHYHDEAKPPPRGIGESDVGTLSSENERLRQLLEKNMTLLQQILSSPTVLQNCPPDLHDRLVESVNSESFLNELESLRRKSTSETPFDEPSGTDLEKTGDLVDIGHEEPSWWVWVPREMAHGKIEEKSEIDSENYIVISEKDVVDGVAFFMARCVLANPNAKKLTPVELQKVAIVQTKGDSNNSPVLTIHLHTRASLDRFL
ncbi:uncharacterized protein LOC127257156 isoform X2 [Andrographis paniculata]|uniref:uncharacterized protein LOC127257156 isoform X2 n=1 Tax=Andrographis paniculata TaxID=175694 RepID=UPI0021E97BED|nr:uncharacterized protein LOC127257156 isoform X2 [Andrographis paniculata]